MSIGLSRWRWWWLRSQFCDQPQNLLEHLPWDSDLGHLEDERPWRTTFAPILISFSFRLVSDLLTFAPSHSPPAPMRVYEWASLAIPRVLRFSPASG
jgi:hypothetical protein